jgi:hypothetical protein
MLNTRPDWFVLLQWQLKVQSPLTPNLQFPLHIPEILCTVLSPDTGHPDCGHFWLLIIRRKGLALSIGPT